MKTFLAIVSILFFSQAFCAEVWKVEHSAILRKQAPGTPQYADTIFTSKADCEKGIDQALGDQKNSYMRTNYTCVLMSSTSDPSAPSVSAPTTANAAAHLGTAIIKNIFSPTQTGHNIAGQNNFQDFGGKKPDALDRDKDQFGFIASVPADPADESVKPHQLPNKNAEKVCGQMKQLSCYSTRGFSGCCPKGYSYLAAPAGMAAMGDICGTDAADKQGWSCLCYKDNAVCINSKQGMCYGCSEM
ncbi:MAG: hypothetical protein WC635_11980 [Bacteriovorax sp.]|jgi:hypothetical protein